MGGAGGVGVGDSAVVGAVGTSNVGGTGGEMETQRRAVWKPLLITLGLMVAQQFSGINSMIFNMETIFASVGFNDNKKAAIIIGATQVVATLFSVLLIDNIGRRKLLMTSALGTGEGAVGGGGRKEGGGGGKGGEGGGGRGEEEKGED